MADDGLDGLDEGTDSSAPAKGNKAGELHHRRDLNEE